MSAYSDPATQAAAVTPSDSTEVNARALYVGGAGNVVVQMMGVSNISPGAASVTFTAVPAGTLLPISVRRVMATTSATSIVALY